LKRKSKGAAKVAIIGTGLIGASLGLALHKTTGLDWIVGWDRQRANARQAKVRGAIDEIAPSLENAIAAAKIIFLAVPQNAILAVLRRTIEEASPGALIMDTAGLKRPVMDAAARLLASRRDISFVGGHPLAGSEKSGPANATSDLFSGKAFFLCVSKHRRIPKAAYQRAERIAKRLGAKPVLVSAALHDRIVAATSALPQLVSSGLALAIADSGSGRADFVGPGYLDATRLAQSPARLWASNFIANKGNILKVLRRFERRVGEFRSAIVGADSRKLGRLLRNAGSKRRRLCS